MRLEAMISKAESLDSETFIPKTFHITPLSEDSRGMECASHSTALPTFYRYCYSLGAPRERFCPVSVTSLGFFSILSFPFLDLSHCPWPGSPTYVAQSALDWVGHEHSINMMSPLSLLKAHVFLRATLEQLDSCKTPS